MNRVKQFPIEGPVFVTAATVFSVEDKLLVVEDPKGELYRFELPAGPATFELGEDVQVVVSKPFLLRTLGDE